MPLEQFQGKGFLGFLDSSSPGYNIWANSEKLHGRVEEDLCFIVNNGGFLESTSVLESVRSPSPFVSSSTTTLSSSHGGPSGDGAAAVFNGADEKCDQMGFEDLDGVLSGCSPGQEQSIFRFMSGDVVDPGSQFVGFDTASGSDPVIDNPNPLFGYGFPFHDSPGEEKFQTLTNSEILMNPNPGFLSDPPISPPPKRLNSSQHGFGNHNQQWGFPFSDPGQDSHDPFLSQPKLAGEEDDESTVIIDQLFSAAAELIRTTTNGRNNNPILAQEILARLNHNLNNDTNNNPKPPFHRAASYITDALHSLLHDSSSSSSSSPSLSPQPLILQIAAYRAFSETSPFLQFVNFTANQTILESFEGFDRIHIVDFDISYGGQWASLIQELAGRRTRTSSAPSLKITAFASPSTVSDEFELRFTEENLRNFAENTGVSFEIELLNMEILLNPTNWPLSLFRSSEKEATAVNLPINSIISGYLPLILRFLKQISPNVVVCSDRSCDRNNDAPFPNCVIHALQYYTSLLESFDSSNNAEAATCIERFYVQPSIQKLLKSRYHWMEKSPPWRSLFGQYGFSPVKLSQTAETQAEYLLQRNPMRGFHLEKMRQSSSSLVLCWQRKELVAVSAWKC